MNRSGATFVFPYIHLENIHFNNSNIIVHFQSQLSYNLVFVTSSELTVHQTKIVRPSVRSAHFSESQISCLAASQKES